MMSALTTYSFIFSHGAQKALGDRAELISTAVLFMVVTLVFTMVYLVVPVHELGHPELTAAHLAWYVAITEIITLTAGSFARELRDDIQAGRFTTLMQRPKELLLQKLADWGGQFIVYSILLLAIALVWMTLLTGSIPFSLYYVPILLLAMFIGALLNMTLLFIINLTEVWGNYARVAGWLSQKFMFVLGGLFFPPLFFPDAIKALAWLTPFPAMLYGPGSFMLARPVSEIALGMMIQSAWLGLLMISALAFYRRAVKHVLREGN